MNRSRLIGHLFAFVTIAIWSTAFVGNKVLLAHLTPIEIMIDRFILAYGGAACDLSPLATSPILAR